MGIGIIDERNVAPQEMKAGGGGRLDRPSNSSARRAVAPWRPKSVINLSGARRCGDASCITVLKIISGGQTGVDRAALDAALKHRINCGGWCPSGRLDENGVIPDHYPLKELEHGGFVERTLQNVKDADGTVIIYFDELRGGSEQTVRFCLEQKRPHRLINGAQFSAERAAELINEFVREQKIVTLNVAGPRHSEAPHGYDYAFRALDIFLLGIVT
jgi:Circularly permutated YpsA SLOG family/A-macroglobulin receptor binding domain